PGTRLCRPGRRPGWRRIPRRRLLRTPENRPRSTPATSSALALVSPCLLRIDRRGPAHPVVRPGLAAHAVVAEEEPLGVIFLLDAREARVVLAPECLLPIGLEIIRFVDIAPGAGREIG